MKSVVSYPERGQYGNSKYRGNATGKLIIDLQQVYKFNSVSDYMSGSFTTQDVGRDLGITTNCYDLNSGFDLITQDIPERNEFIYWHPPYWDIIKYSGYMYGDRPLKNDLSHIADYDKFIRAINYCLYKQYVSLENGGRMAILMADVKKKGKLYSMLLDMDKVGTLEQIVIKEQINCMSDNKQYSNNNFIRIAHEYCLILKKELPLMFDFTTIKKGTVDLRNCTNITWKDLIASIMESIGGIIELSIIYDRLKGYKKTSNNSDWKAKVRQTLQIYPKVFKNISKGQWSLV